jgi:hypothetical protein
VIANVESDHADLARAVIACEAIAPYRRRMIGVSRDGWSVRPAVSGRVLVAQKVDCRRGPREVLDRVMLNAAVGSTTAMGAVGRFVSWPVLGRMRVAWVIGLRRRRCWGL